MGTSPFLGEIMMVGFNFAPSGWALCDGQLLSISQHSALFALLGTAYGGDGRTTFGLPDLRGRVPIHAGSGPGLTRRLMGQKAGVENVALTPGQIPSHTHQAALHASDSEGNSAVPGGHILAKSGSGDPDYTSAGPGVVLRDDSISVDASGGGQSHDNMQPFITVNFIIATSGVFPSRP